MENESQHVAPPQNRGNAYPFDQRIGNDQPRTNVPGPGTAIASGPQSTSVPPVAPTANTPRSTGKKAKRIAPLFSIEVDLTPREYDDPPPDMGASLGYGQGMEYQYFNVPQPSQPLPEMRRERLQQLRQELQDLQQGGMQPRQAMETLRQQTAGISRQDIMRAQQAAVQNSLDVQEHDAMQIPEEPAQSTAAMQKVRVGRAAFVLSGAFIASRVLGLVRQSMFTAIFGATVISDAYSQAFLIPDTIFTIVAGGALSSAFIPVFTKYMVAEKDEKTAWHIADTALTMATVVMVILAVLAIIFAGPLVKIYNPIDPHQKLSDYLYESSLITMLMRIMLWQSVILGSSVIVNSVLNARQNFTLPAIGTVFYNLGPIIGLIPGLFLVHGAHPNPTLAVYCAGGGVVIGAAFQLGTQLFGLKGVGMRYKPSFDWRHPAVLQIGKQMIPRIINAGMLSVSTFTDRLLIGFLGALAVGSALDGLKFEYAQAYQLVALPIGIIGMAMSTAAFPTIAEYASKGRMERVRSIILETLRSILFLSFPAGIGMIILGLPIIQVLLMHGAFSLANAQTTDVALAFYSVGMGGYAAVEILTRAFYAMRDSKTPVIISVLQFLLKIAMGLILLTPFASIGGAPWGMGALSFSTSLSSMIEAIALFILLHQRIGELMQRSLFVFIGRVLVACAAMGASLFIVSFLLDKVLNTTNPHAAHFMSGGILAILANLVKLLLEIAVGTVVYFRVARLFNLEELGPVRRMLARFCSLSVVASKAVCKL